MMKAEISQINVSSAHRASYIFRCPRNRRANQKRRERRVLPQKGMTRPGRMQEAGRESL